MIISSIFSSLESMAFYCTLFLVGYAGMYLYDHKGLFLEKMMSFLTANKESTSDTTTTTNNNNNINSKAAGIPSVEATMTLIKNRRSVFVKDWKPSSEEQVPREYVEQLLEAANHAPTHDKTEPWHFVVFESVQARTQLGEVGL
jgi:hypothetical protein